MPPRNVSLSAGCDDLSCDRFASPLLNQLLDGAYDRMAVLHLDDEWQPGRTARRRANRAHRLGYRFSEFDRTDFQDDIHQINTSMPERQGRPMADGYQHRRSFSRLPHYPCPRHRIDSYGALDGGTLVAYLVMHQSGDLALVSQILGHGDHLAYDVMYLLALGALEQTPRPSVVVYNRWDSGGDGLRYFKGKLGFAEQEVAWSP